ncbi:hypothetical protein EI77_01104 [Prosthecobacter fusiformis]|uniref:EF-hand domain-containing protein n=1 Tax=Prosthecobacter fusiformis TaxID=48464 RepID=A0A4R7SS18_9BACT|nr:hypothetical protein [Prosthecobacter fusiformis]TDU81794.1 hypothetical protein EI77_01104 [Prosthecobacter fusiformis]
MKTSIRPILFAAGFAMASNLLPAQTPVTDPATPPQGARGEGVGKNEAVNADLGSALKDSDSVFKRLDTDASGSLSKAEFSKLSDNEKTETVKSESKATEAPSPAPAADAAAPAEPADNNNRPKQ